MRTVALLVGREFIDYRYCGLQKKPDSKQQDNRTDIVHPPVRPAGKKGVTGVLK